MEALRTCKVCGGAAYTRDDLEEFKKDKKGKYGRANYHKGCYEDRKKEWRVQNPQKNRELNRKHNKKYNIKKSYGITVKEYDTCMDTSDACEICGSVNKLCYDHDHVTGEFRGVLCSQCNMTLGKCGDTLEGVIRFIKYLEG